MDNQSRTLLSQLSSEYIPSTALNHVREVAQDLRAFSLTPLPLLKNGSPLASTRILFKDYGKTMKIYVKDRSAIKIKNLSV